MATGESSTDVNGGMKTTLAAGRVQVE